MKVTTPHGTAYVWDRFRAHMPCSFVRSVDGTTMLPMSRSVTGHKVDLIMQHAKTLQQAITEGSHVELIPHTLENEAPLLILVWRSRFEELRHIPGYQRHDFVVVADPEGADDHLHTHAFNAAAATE